MKNRIKELEEKVLQARRDYYNNTPKVSDLVFDAWADELEKLDPNNIAIISVGAPLAVTEWKKAKHSVPMGSLNKVNTEEELSIWAKSCQLSSDFLLTEKLDGISINTVWANGKLVQAVTRGNSEEGEDITANVLKMKGIPKKLGESFSGNIRGEIVLFRSDHKKHFADYSNPRNAASGIAKRYDGKNVEHLNVIMYTVAGKDFATEFDQFNWLKLVGLKIPNYKLCKTLKDVLKEYNAYQESVREKLDYEIDGLVVRANDLEKQFALGEKNHRPKGAVAFKFDAAGKETTIRRIVWQVGNSGRITPVAEFDKIDLGVDVERASLYNYSYIKNLRLDVGAKVIVIRANDVIPRVEEVVKSSGSVAGYPDKCPECNSNTLWNGEYLLCSNKASCPAQVIGRLKSWINELNILEWGDGVLQRAIDANLLTDVADLYKLIPEQLEPLDRMGKRSATKLVDIIDKHREVPLENLIGGLGIEGVATSMTRLIINAGYDSLDAILKMSRKELEAIDGFGSIRAETFYNGLIENKDRINNILKAGVKIKARAKGVLTNKSFCFTGAAETPRPQLHRLVEENGGEVKKSVGKGLNYLVVADPSSTSSKSQAARKLGTKVISEQDFLDMISSS